MYPAAVALTQKSGRGNERRVSTMGANQRETRTEPKNTGYRKWGGKKNLFRRLKARLRWKDERGKGKCSKSLGN